MRRSGGVGLPTCALPVLAGSSGGAVDRAALPFFLAQNLTFQEEQQRPGNEEATSMIWLCMRKDGEVRHRLKFSRSPVAWVSRHRKSVSFATCPISASRNTLQTSSGSRMTVSLTWRCGGEEEEEEEEEDVFVVATPRPLVAWRVVDVFASCA